MENAARVGSRDYWLDIGNYNLAWDKRALAASRIIRGDWVCDIGCGRQALKRFLRPGTVYLPADITAWDNHVEICDLNEKSLPERSLLLCDAVVLLGVVERIHDLPWLFSELSERSESLIVSYHASYASVLPEGWMHRYSKREFETLIRNAGYEIDKVISHKAQTIWRAKSLRYPEDRHKLRASARTSLPQTDMTLSSKIRRLLWPIVHLA